MATPSALRKLPPELYILILEQCDCPSQIRYFISADPVALSCYKQHKSHILRSVEAALHEAIGLQTLVSTAVIATRLRNLRQNSALYDDEGYAQRARFLMANSVDPTARQPPASLGFLCSFSTLISDADEMLSEYNPTSWIQEQKCRTRQYSGNPVEHGPPQPSGLDISSFRRRVFQWEIFSCYGFREDSMYPKRRYFQSRSKGKEFLGDFERHLCYTISFEDISAHIAEQYQQICERVAISISSMTVTRATLGNANLWEAMMNDPTFPDSPAGHRFFCATMQKDGGLEKRPYIRWLCSHSFPLLRALQRMNHSDQEKFIITNFFRIQKRAKYLRPTNK